MDYMFARLDDGLDEGGLSNTRITGNQHLQASHGLAGGSERPATGQLDAGHDQLWGGANGHHGVSFIAMLTVVVRTEDLTCCQIIQKGAREGASS
jgi:hypothetical protein